MMGGSAEADRRGGPRRATRTPSTSAAAVRLAVRALGSDGGPQRRVARARRRGPRGRGARPHPGAAAQVPPGRRRPARRRCSTGRPAPGRRPAAQPPSRVDDRRRRRPRSCCRATPATVDIERAGRPAGDRRGRGRPGRGLDRPRADRRRLAGAPGRRGAEPRPRRGRPRGRHGRAGRPGRGRAGRRRRPAARDRRRGGREPADLPARDGHRRRLGQGRRARRAVGPSGRPDALRRLAPDGRLAPLRAGDRGRRAVRRPDLGRHPAPQERRRRRPRAWSTWSGPAAPASSPWTSTTTTRPSPGSRTCRT